MSQQVLDPVERDFKQADPGRRHPHHIDETLILTELNPESVVDHLDSEYAPVELSTFGTVRELCPKCQQAHLRLVLRQQCVRTAHLFCDECQSCFDAHYKNGASALTI
ncbi:MAG: hypothetical protein V4633_25715 [Pseudomonadota bacterium]